MEITQLSVFIENKAGRITEVSNALAQAGLNIRGFAVSDTQDFGIVRVIVDNPSLGRKALEEAGFTVRETPVLVINLSQDKPGGLAAALKTVSDAGVNVEYIYSLVSTYLALNVADVERARTLLKDTDIEIVSQETLK